MKELNAKEAKDKDYIKVPIFLWKSRRLSSKKKKWKKTIFFFSFKSFVLVGVVDKASKLAVLWNPRSPTLCFLSLKRLPFLSLKPLHSVEPLKDLKKDNETHLHMIDQVLRRSPHFGLLVLPSHRWVVELTNKPSILLLTFSRSFLNWQLGIAKTTLLWTISFTKISTNSYSALVK